MTPHSPAAQRRRTTSQETLYALATRQVYSGEAPHRRRPTGQLPSGGEARNRRRSTCASLIRSGEMPCRRRPIGQLLSGGEARNRRRLTGHQDQHVAAKRLTGDAPLASCSVEAKRVTGDALLATRLNMAAKRLTGDAPLASCSVEAKLVTGDARLERRSTGHQNLWWRNASQATLHWPAAQWRRSLHRRSASQSTLCWPPGSIWRRSASQVTLHWPAAQWRRSASRRRPTGHHAQYGGEKPHKRRSTGQLPS